MNPPPKSVPRKKLASYSSVTFLLIVMTFVGQLLGFLRTKLVNANFPITGPHSTDAYFAAFNIPDFFFFTLSAGALGVAFMPVLSDRLHKSGVKGMWDISASVMNLLFIIMSGVGVIILVFARPLIANVVAPHLSPPQMNNAIDIMRLLAFNPLLFTISGILTSVQQTMGRFFFYAIAPLFYNLSIIVSIYVFKDNIGLVGLGIGALIGAILQLIIVAIGAMKLNYYWHPHIMWRSRDFKTVLRNLPPRSLDQGMDQIENIVETHIASGLGTGSISFYNNAYILSTAPILLLGTAISTAAFPRLNNRMSQGRPDLFRKDFLMILRAMIWVSAPIVVICYFTRGYLAHIIFSRGSAQIAAVFGFLTLSIFSGVMYAIISRWFYSQKDTKTPLLVSIFTIALNIILAYTLSRPSAFGLTGLALAQSIVATTEVAILFIIMLWRDHKLLDANFWSGIVRIISVTGFSVVAGYTMISLYPLKATDTGIFPLGGKLALVAGVTFLVHILVSSLFELEEVRPIFSYIRKVVLRPIQLDM